MAIIEGTCREEFCRPQGVRVPPDCGIDVGASVAVFIDGEPVVDLWGGYFDATYTRPWERDTIVQTFSTTTATWRLSRSCRQTTAYWTSTRRSSSTGRSSAPRASPSVPPARSAHCRA